MDTTYRFVWTAKAIAAFEQGKRDLAHTISDAGAWPEGFVRQMRPGCPWIICDRDWRIVERGEGPLAQVTRRAAL